MNPLELILWALAIAGCVLIVGGASAVAIALLRGAVGKAGPR